MVGVASKFHSERFAHRCTIAFAFVATHNHFVLDRGGKVFNRSAPIIKLPADATEDDHLGSARPAQQFHGLLLDEASTSKTRAAQWIRRGINARGIGRTFYEHHWQRPGAISRS